MIFAVFFVLAFLLGVLAYLLSNRWLVAVCVPMILYVLVFLFDDGFGLDSVTSLIFGLPIMFVGGLLGAYIVELRRGLNEEDLPVDEADLRHSSEQPSEPQ